MPVKALTWPRCLTSKGVNRVNPAITIVVVANSVPMKGVLAPNRVANITLKKVTTMPRATASIP